MKKGEVAYSRSRGADGGKTRENEARVEIALSRLMQSANSESYQRLFAEIDSSPDLMTQILEAVFSSL